MLGVEARFARRRVLLCLILLAVSPYLSAAQDIPCPTFERRSVNCTQQTHLGSPSPISILSTDQIEDFTVVDSTSAIYAQHPSPIPPMCHLIGTIDKQIDLSDHTDQNIVVSVSQIVDYLGASFVAFQKPPSKEWSKIYSCIQ